jgi:hypothetical protein
MAKASKGEKGLAKRVGAIERKVDALTREAPIPAEQAANMATARQSMAGDVADQMVRLQGRRTSTLTPDAERGSASGLGHGTGSQPMRKGRRG